MGSKVGAVGIKVGLGVGTPAAIVGPGEGEKVGSNVGNADGLCVGSNVGSVVGLNVGIVGMCDG